MANTKVTSSVIKDDAVGADQLASNAVVTASMIDDAVTSAKIANDAIITALVADNAINNAKLSSNSVGTDQYVDNSIQAVHLQSGSVTSAKLDTNMAIGGTLTLGSHLIMGDDDIIKLGASADLQIFHADNNSYVSDAGAGDLHIRGENNILFQNANSSSNYATMTNGGAVSLYYAGAAKLATASGGVTVTGNIANASGDLKLDVAGDIILDAGGQNWFFDDDGTRVFSIAQVSSDVYLGTEVADKDMIFRVNDSDGGGAITALTLDASDAGTATFNHDIKLSDNGKAIFGAGSDLQIYHDASNSYIVDGGDGNLNIQTNGTAVVIEKTDGTNLAVFNAGNGVVSLYHNGTEKLATASGGVSVTGTINSGAITSTGSSTFTSTSTMDINLVANPPELNFEDTSSTSGTKRARWTLDANNFSAQGLSDNDGSVTQSLLNFSLSSGAATFGGTINSGSITSSGIVKTATTFQSSSGSMLFFVPNVGEALRIAQNTGNVGIGTSSPTQAKTVIGSSVSGKYLYLDDGSNGALQIKADTSTVIMEFVTTGFGAFETADLRANEFIFKNSGTNELVRINGDGVGIGMTPTNTLSVKANGNANIIGVQMSGNTVDLVSLNQFNDHGAIFVRGNNGVIQHEITATGGVVFNQGSLDQDFRVESNNNTHAIFVDGSSVDVFFGASSTTYPTGANFVHINEQSGVSMVIGGHSGTHTVLQFRHNGSATVGSVVINASSTTYNTSSDYRLKENVDYDFTALDRVVQLKPARFNFIADADTTVDGFLAHEVQEIVPEAVTGEKDGETMQGMDYGRITPLLVKAIQEQQTLIESLTARIEELEG